MDLYINDNPSIEDAEVVGDAVRDSQRAVLESIGATPSDSCIAGIKSSEYIFTINTKEKPVALVGLVEHPNEDDAAIVWSLSSDVVKEFPIAYAKAIHKLLYEHAGLYSRVYSMASVNNEAHQRFQRFLGMSPTGREVSIKGANNRFKVYELITTKGLNEQFYGQH